MTEPIVIEEFLGSLWSVSEQRQTYQAAQRIFVFPGEKIEIFHHNPGPGNTRGFGDLVDVKAFKVGDQACHDNAYNFQKFGRIRSITTKAITIVPFDFGFPHDRIYPRRLDFADFSFKNHDFDLERNLNILKGWNENKKVNGLVNFLNVPTF